MELNAGQSNKVSNGKGDGPLTKKSLIWQHDGQHIAQWDQVFANFPTTAEALASWEWLLVSLRFLKLMTGRSRLRLRHGSTPGWLLYLTVKLLLEVPSQSFLQEDHWRQEDRLRQTTMYVIVEDWEARKCYFVLLYQRRIDGCLVKRFPDGRLKDVSKK